MVCYEISTASARGNISEPFVPGARGRIWCICPDRFGRVADPGDCKVILTRVVALRTLLMRMAEYVSNHVNRFRTKLGMTQEELAAKTGVSRQTIIAIEKGNYAPSVLLALKISKLFKAPVEDVFSISYEK